MDIKRMLACLAMVAAVSSAALVFSPHAFAQTASPPSNVLSDVKQISAGMFHTCALTVSGVVKCWGNNTGGALGVGVSSNQPFPRRVINLPEGIVGIAAGGLNTCAWTAAGPAKCWGDDYYPYKGPLDMIGLETGVIAMDVGRTFACALIDGGAVKCASNGFGGDFSKAVPGADAGMTAVSVGAEHACAVTAAGGVKCWGSNSFGQLGLPPGPPQYTAVDVSGLDSGVVAVTAGNAHTCALLQAGSVKCWGDNSLAQLGQTASGPHETPVDVVGISGEIVGITAGDLHTCAVTRSGAAVCWGSNDEGQLGDGAPALWSTPVLVSGKRDIYQAVSAGTYHTCALTYENHVRCWGAPYDGMLGNGRKTEQPLPIRIDRLKTQVVKLAAGKAHTCALMQTGGVKCWGQNIYDQLGDGSSAVMRWQPRDVAGLTSGVQTVSAGTLHTCAVMTDGGARCWGTNNYGQLGDGTFYNSPIPVDVVGLAGGAVGVAAGGRHSCALLTNGSVMCWGANDQGQLGNGSDQDSPEPVPVLGLPQDIVSLGAGNFYTCALTRDRRVFCWGARRPLAEVSEVRGIVADLAAGGLHTCVLTVDHRVWCWGDNFYSQLGVNTGSTFFSETPLEVTALGSEVTAIAAGSAHSCVLTPQGVRCWGSNFNGELGIGVVDDYNDPAQFRFKPPVPVEGLDENVTSLAVGSTHSCVSMADGSIVCWGQNHRGQLAVDPGWTPVDVLALLDHYLPFVMP